MFSLAGKKTPVVCINMSVKTLKKKNNTTFIKLSVVKKINN